MKFCFRNIPFPVDWTSGNFHCLRHYFFKKVFVNSWSLFLNLFFRRIVFFGKGDFSSSLSSMNLLSQEWIISFLISGVDCSAESTICRISFFAASPCCSFHLAYASNRSFRTFASSRSRAGLSCSLYIGLLSLLSAPFLTIFRCGCCTDLSWDVFFGCHF